MGWKVATGAVGLDPERADERVARWRAAAAELRAGADRQRSVIAVLALPPPPGTDEWVATRLTAMATELERRAAGLRAWDVGGVDGPGGAGSWAGPPRGDPDEDWWTWVVGGGRRELLAALALDSGPWAALVAAGTVGGTAVTRTYTAVPPLPGGGLVVVDLFIPFPTSLGLDGDDRDHDDPLFGAVDDDDSRVVMAFDLERGRAVIQFHETCALGGLVCRAPRPVDLDGRWFVATEDPGADLAGGDIANQVRIEADGTRLTVAYDLLNSIVPVGSTDGTFTLRDQGQGVLAVETIEVDEYPSIGIYQYRAPSETRVLHRQDSADVWTLFPTVPPVVADLLVDGGIDGTGTARESEGG